MRTISSGSFLTVAALERSGAIPEAYKVVPPGTDKAPGLIGEGFGGEALVCLLPEDDGAWFEQAARAKDLDTWLDRTE